MGELDHGAKLALRIDPVSILRLGLPEADDVRPFPGEVVSAQRTADGAFLVTIDGEQVAVHVEMEAEPTSDVGQRVARAACALYAAHGRPVRPVVFYLHESADRRRPKDSVVLRIGDKPCRLQFPRVAMWEVDPEVALASGAVGLLAFVGLMRGATLDHVRRASRGLDLAALERPARADMQAALFFLSGARFDRTALTAIMRGEAIMVTSSTYQWVVQTGYVKGVRATLARLLQVRLGVVPPEVQRAIDETEAPAILEQASEELVRCTSDAELPAAILRVLRPGR